MGEVLFMIYIAVFFSEWYATYEQVKEIAPSPFVSSGVICALWPVTWFHFGIRKLSRWVMR